MWYQPPYMRFSAADQYPRAVIRRPSHTTTPAAAVCKGLYSPAISSMGKKTTRNSILF